MHSTSIVSALIHGYYVDEGERETKQEKTLKLQLVTGAYVWYMYVQYCRAVQLYYHNLYS